MKRVCLAFVAAFILLSAHSASAQINPLEWNTEGIKVNPAANTVLAQFQNLNPTGETHQYHFVVASSVAAILFLEHIGADGTTVIRSQAFVVNTLVTFEGMHGFITLDANERIRVRTSAIIVGSCQASIFLDT